MEWGRGALAGLLCLWMYSFPLSASSFALRGMEIGSRVPDLELAGITGEGGRLSSYTGEKGLVLIFWATWSARSPDVLRFADKELRRYEKLGLKLLAVDADHQEMKQEDIARVKAVISALGITFPAVLDPGLKGYDGIGVISMPTTILLDKSLKIVDVYPGFPSIARDDIPDRLDAFLGIAREKPVEKARYLLDHRPRNHALQYYNLGKRLFQIARSPSGELRSVPDQAMERLDEAIRRDADFFRPYLLKAIILDLAKSNGRREEALQELKKRDFQEVHERRALGFGYLYIDMDPLAAEHFQLLSSQVPEDPGVLFGAAVVAARRKDARAASKALSALAKDPKARETLGFDFASLFAPSGELRPGSEGALRLALERLLEIERLPEGGSIRKDAPAAPGNGR